MRCHISKIMIWKREKEEIVSYKRNQFFPRNEAARNDDLGIGRKPTVSTHVGPSAARAHRPCPCALAGRHTCSHGGRRASPPGHHVRLAPVAARPSDITLARRARVRLALAARSPAPSHVGCTAAQAAPLPMSRAIAWSRARARHHASLVAT